MSPPSPANLESVRGAMPELNDSLVPKVSSLEASSARQKTELVMLRQSNEEMDVWKARIDFLSGETAGVLDNLTQEVEDLKYVGHV